MIIKFREIEIQGFMSMGHSTVEFTDKGLVLIRGINQFEELSESNGSGKSSIFESVIWTLTGYTSRNSSNIVNRYTTTGAMCKLTLEVDGTEYVVRRTKDHSQYGTSLTIVKDGEDISGNTKTKSEKVLATELPKLSYAILTSIVVLSQGLPGRLSSMKPSQRKSTLEELSSSESYLSVLDSKMIQASKTLSDSKMNLLSEISRRSGMISSSESAIRNANQQIQSILDSQKDLITPEECAQLEEELAVNQAKHSELSTEYSNLSNKLNELSMIIRDSSSNVDKYKYELQVITNTFTSVNSKGECPTCHRPLADQQYVQSTMDSCMEQSITIKQKISQELDRSNVAQAELDSNSSRLTEISSQLDELSSRINDSVSKVSKFKSFSDKTEYIKASIVTNEECIQTAKKESAEFEEQLSKVESQLSIHAYIKRQMTKKFRSFLLQGTIDYMNTKLDDYSKVLFKNQGVVSLDVNKNNIDIKLGDSYFEELSGGESRRVDLLLQLAQRDLARNESGFSSNILVLDEALDYLDNAGIESVIDLIESKSEDVESILVVSHKTDVKLPYDEMWTVVKDSNRVSSIQ